MKNFNKKFPKENEAFVLLEKKGNENGNKIVCEWRDESLPTRKQWWGTKKQKHLLIKDFSVELKQKKVIMEARKH